MADWAIKKELTAENTVMFSVVGVMAFHCTGRTHAKVLCDALNGVAGHSMPGADSAPLVACPDGTEVCVSASCHHYGPHSQGENCANVCVGGDSPCQPVTKIPGDKE